MDLAKLGTGTITFDDNLTVFGENTKFKEEFQPGDQLFIISPKGQDKVEE